MIALAGAGIFDLSAQSIQQPMRAVYNQPAKNWEEEALPIGNGYMGAMIFGGIERDRIQTNEKTLWSGGPGEDANYNGGHLHTPESAKKALQDFRRKLQENMTEFTANHGPGVLDNYHGNGNYYDEKYGFGDYNGTGTYLNGLLGTKEHFGSFQAMGNIFIDEAGNAGTPTILPESISTNYDHSKNPNQRIAMAFDGNTSTKWYADDHDNKTFPVNIFWAYNKAPQVSSYTLVSANDAAGRDPYAWKLYGSTDGENYVVIDEQNSGPYWDAAKEDTEHRNEARTFTLKEPVSEYKYFKLEILRCLGTSHKPQLSEITLNFTPGAYEGAKDYKRELDLDRGKQTVSYTLDGVQYTREYFMSYPDNVMVVHLTATSPFSRKITVDTPHSDYNLTINDDNQIVLSGWPTPVSGQKIRENDNWKDYLRFAQVVGINSTDGTVRKEDNALFIDNATDVVLVMSAATNYKPCYDNSFDYIDHSINPIEKAKEAVDAVKSKEYTALESAHIDDYQKLYNANKIQIGSNITVPTVTTDELLTRLRDGGISESDNRYLETLYYQFGRYLLIASSRPGSLPANLQGVWCDKTNGAWNSDYHTNINVQMNYWPAEQTNLSECHLPMTDFVRSLEPRGTLTAQHYHCTPEGNPVRGWTTYHEVNAWGNTAPAAKGTHSYFPEGAMWICQDIWEHYQFTQDKQFLADNYNTLLNACLFWVDNLWEDERDGTLVANPSLSPEHGDFSLGCTATQGIIYEMFTAAIEGATVLGRDNESDILEIVEARKRLSMPKIGLGGQFMEWKDEVTRDLTGDGSWNAEEKRYKGTHRHTNHLFWLHPGSQIVPGRSAEETAFADAMKTTLNTRGDEGTGWSRAWKLNFWARLRDGNRAHSLLKGCMNLTSNYSQAPGGVYKNLFDAHPPFQIDGNFGVTSGMAEMLIQSQGGAIELLPSLPDVWKEGAFEGMRARGGYQVDAKWQDGCIREVTIVKDKGDNEDCIIKFRGAGSATVTGANVKERIGNNQIIVEAVVNQPITITSDFKVVPVEESKCVNSVPGVIIAGDFDWDSDQYYHKQYAEQTAEKPLKNDYDKGEEKRQARIESSGKISNTSAGDFFTYYFKVAKDDVYTVNAVVEKANGNASEFTVEFEDGDKQTLSFSGMGWGVPVSVPFTKELEAGFHWMKVYLNTNNNLCRFEFNGTTPNTSVLRHSIPGTIVAGLFDTEPGSYYHKNGSEGTRSSNYPYNRFALASVSSGGKIEHSTTGDYYNYTFNCPEGGDFYIAPILGASQNSNNEVTMSIDGKLVITVPFKGLGWDEDSHKPVLTPYTVYIPEGSHRLEVKITKGAPNLKSYVFSANYAWTEVDDVLTDSQEAPVNVYSIYGHVIRLNVKAENALDGLAPGLYIVGNRKVIKR